VVRMGLSPAWFIRSSQKCIGGKSPSVWLFSCLATEIIKQVASLATGD